MIEGRALRLHSLVHIAFKRGVLVHAGEGDWVRHYGIAVNQNSIYWSAMVEIMYAQTIDMQVLIPDLRVAALA